MLRITVLTLTIATAALVAGCQHDQQAALSPRQPAFGFFFLDEGPSAKLAYGEPQSDNVGLMLECAKGSKRVEISDPVRSAAAPTLTLISATARSELKAEVQPGEGAPIAVAHAASTIPALTGFRRSGRMEISYAGLHYAVAAKPAERVSIERFFTACERRAT